MIIMKLIGTATHETAKYLAKLLSPLSKSNYTINSEKQFVNHIRKQKVPKGQYSRKRNKRTTTFMYKERSFFI